MTCEGGTGGDGGGGAGGAGAAVNFRDGIAIVFPFDVTSVLHAAVDGSVVFDVAVVEFDVGAGAVGAAVFGTAIFSLLLTPVVGFNCDDDWLDANPVATDFVAVAGGVDATVFVAVVVVVAAAAAADAAAAVVITDAGTANGALLLFFTTNFCIFFFFFFFAHTFSH